MYEADPFNVVKAALNAYVGSRYMYLEPMIAPDNYAAMRELWDDKEEFCENLADMLTNMIDGHLVEIKLGLTET